MIPPVNVEVGSDLEPLVQAMRGWELELCPLSPPSGPSEVRAVGAEGFVASRVKIGAATRQSGAAPGGLRTFGLPEGDGEDTQWCGRRVESRSLTVFTRSGSFEATARAGFGVQLCSVSEERLAAACADLGLPEPDRLLGATSQVFECAPDALATLRTRLRQLFSEADAPAACPVDHVAREATSLLVLAAATSRQLRPRIDPRRGRRALDRALGAIHENPRTPHTVQELCTRTGVSERTLRHAFQQRFGVSPRTYLRALCLNGVRRELRAADPAIETVIRVAHRWNFRNAGDLAAHYARLFGERPSETLRRPARG